MNMDDKVVRELIKLGAEDLQYLPNGWLSFAYNKWEMLYIPGKQQDTYTNLRICIPEFRVGARNRLEILTESVNDLNKNLRYVKAVILDNGVICINYDHKCYSGENMHHIVEHMLKVLSFAAEYLCGKVEAENQML